MAELRRWTFGVTKVVGVRQFHLEMPVGKVATLPLARLVVAA
jgi:hypothetical protein